MTDALTMSRRRSGLTLTEQLISLAILGIVVVVAVNLFISSARFSADEQARIDVGAAASRIFSNLDETLRQGRQVLASAVIDGTTYTTGDTTLVLALPAIVGGTLTADNDTVVVRLDATTSMLQQIVSPYVDPAPGNPGSSTRSGGTVQLTGGVSDVYFRYPTDDPTTAEAVTVTVTARQTVMGRPFSQRAIIYATLRNHS